MPDDLVAPDSTPEGERATASFSDYFGGKSNRFHAFARLEVAAADVPRLGTAIRETLAAANVRAPHWKNLNGARERFAAQGLFEFAARKMRAGTLRVKVDVWDARGFRTEELGKWLREIDRRVLRIAENAAPSTGIDAGGYAVSPLSRLAELFAGISSFSYDKFDEYIGWLRRTAPQCALYSNEVAEYLPSKVSIERFQVLRHFLEDCAANGLHVSFERSKGLATTTDAQPDGGANSDCGPQPNRAPLQISFKVD